MLNGGSMVWGFCVYFVYMIPLETDVLRKHRFQKICQISQRGGISVCLFSLVTDFMRLISI